MQMLQTDYPIAALEFLLQEDHLPERFHPLLLYKYPLLEELPKYNVVRKSDAERLSDAMLRRIGIEDAADILLFRRFLTLYDPKPAKLRELSEAASSPEEYAAFRELYLLPGVKKTRAALYYLSGYKGLRDIASASAEDILAATARTIRENRLSCSVPFPKEARTHIAVARAFTLADK